MASFSESNRDRRERLRQLALETIDLNKVSIAVPLSATLATYLTEGLFTGSLLSFCWSFAMGRSGWKFQGLLLSVGQGIGSTSGLSAYLVYPKHGHVL